MRYFWKAFRSTLLAVGVLLVGAGTALAKWPMDKPMTIVVPWAAGTGADLVARVLADGFAKKWGNQVNVENRVGASGNIGQNFVSKAAPDGYTFIVTTPGPAANNMLTFKSLPYNPLTDFSFITITNEDPMVVVAGSKVTAKTVQEFFEYAKANPGKVQFGNPGHGTYAHMTQLALQDLLNTKFNLVPYKAQSQMQTDMMSGQIDAVIDLLGSYLQLVNAGKLRILAVIGNKRVDQLKDIPTLKEAGINLTAEPWYGFEGPKGLPREIVTEMNAAAREILADPAVREKLKGAGITASTSTPEAFESLVKAEVEKWRPIIVKYNITSE